jgi:uncharacterized protein YcfL
MNRYAPLFAALMLFVLAACNSNKPKPVSDTLSKTAIVVNNQKDSVINNSAKNYGNATIADPCVKCIITAVKADENYKKAVLAEKNVKFVINYVKTLQPQDTVSEVKATNALRVDVVDKIPDPHKIATYVYDNNLSKLFFIHAGTKIEIKTDADALKKIRNSCYWGVASGN